MNILVRTPNWLGDFVMSLPFIEALKTHYPDSKIDIILKKELRDLSLYLEGIREVHVFSKKGGGLWGSAFFGKEIRKRHDYDLFFTLPESFSSALMGYFSNSKIRVGYTNECRGFLLTHAYKKEKNQRRVLDYMGLLEKYTGKPHPPQKSNLSSKPKIETLIPKGRSVLLNINSVASSRRMPLAIAREIIKGIKKRYDYNIILSGTEQEKSYVAKLTASLSSTENIYDFSGKTTLKGLVDIVRQAGLVITTDSGIAHLSNAFEKKTIVLFGAGDERKTGPINSADLKIVRKEGVPCAPCVANICRFGNPICMTEMDADLILKEFDNLVQT